ncbi:tRNA-uridine aminocarboxypropyltransferase [Clostridium cellulovorans]|uniref:tRNA-uridine aminocarboxypropyltransferase n=1 Tax=Clostridium cellulovorans (strain ATCC 35296 / DSM 3052 / OCM 3 / 743B) TaxID=573061 RepID=D9ST34_CLOC7|nr:tRNA-uridine aminocarboxypropyltransferase [Clostridium cellulovorans]ADL50650.1 DTW domain containing protein [Clostridium cellulovorans 743B]
MDSKFKVKQITKLYESCNKCGLPVINCICDIVPKIDTKSRICILSTEKEFSRPSNTARLLKLVNPESTELILWERTNFPEKLIEYINSEDYQVYILFPTENDDLSEVNYEYKNSERTPVFVILDGTWKEARKILRKSDYLKRLPRISLDPIHKSEYTLRRGASEGELCTIETAIEVLKLNHEFENAQVIKDEFDLFIKSFKVGVNGIMLKD